MRTPKYLWLLRFLFGSDSEAVLQFEPQDAAEAEVPDIVETEEESPASDPRLPAGHTPVYRWFIDSGHGAFTQGKRGPVLGYIVHIITRQFRLLEWEYNRDITERIIEQLVALGLIWERTMPADGQHGNDLVKRVAVANNFPKDQHRPLFVSLHGNAGPAPTLDDYADNTVRGIETWYFYGSMVGRKMAGIFHSHLLKHTRRFVSESQGDIPHSSRHIVDRGLRAKKTGQFYVLRATRMPAVLIESGFMNSRFDILLMVLPGYRQAVADSAVDAICQIEANTPL